MNKMARFWLVVGFLIAAICCARSQWNGAYWYGWGETAFQRALVPPDAVGWSVVLHRSYHPDVISIALGSGSLEWDWQVVVYPVAERQTPSVRITKIDRSDLGFGAVEWRFVAYALAPRPGDWWVGVGSGDRLFVAWDLSVPGQIYRAPGWGGFINLYTGGGWDNGRLLVEPISETPRVWGPR